MKKFVYALVISVSVLMNSCEEIPPYIDFTEPFIFWDSTYITSTVPQAQHKAVLIEDITGVRCVNCPQAADEIKQIMSLKKDSVVAVALYPNHMPTLTTPWPGFPKLNNETATNMVDFLSVPGALPNGYVDRGIFAPLTERFIQYKSWKSIVDQRLAVPTPVNIHLTSTVNGSKVKVKFTVQYTQDVSEKHKISLFITENGIVSRQTGGTPTTDTYVHNHVMRYAFGNPLGNLLDASLVPGRTFVKEFEYEVPSDFNIDNLNLVCLIAENGTEKVVNVREIHIK